LFCVLFTARSSASSCVDKAVAVAGGAAYPAVNQKDFERIKMTIPEKKLILEFSELVNGNFKLIGNLKVQNQLLKEASVILLHRLMTGMIDVDEIELPYVSAR
jgi:type I restriction enzyme S subunit